ncbi:flagellar biosynthesis repressor FlbT [Bosea sp. 685]|uniref:flagellar biosynthesis repressor FlbT n=1 Tax=Bosea sp. 685 TaxID=3080057 RepID=UPI0028935C1F|nr:flagellar biosynthesis repressor FlbT [Bosea sp. 685]WNJ91313.1 flagellar biosynthesis repressor FlbT [Bosea sp. 685]
MNLSLRANEKIYINGAILKFDRKVSLELLNDATFLLESHVIQADETTTPLRQLYFTIQAMLIEPRNSGVIKLMFERMLMTTARMFEDAAVLAGLQHIDLLVAEDRFFEALKHLRGLYPAEAAILASSGQAPAPKLDDAVPIKAIAAQTLTSQVA